MKKWLLAIVIGVMTLTSCQKEESYQNEKWNFNYPKEQLCASWWAATDYSDNGSYWVSMSALGKYNDIRFWEDGKFSSIGVFEQSASNHTWEAHGNQITIYMHGSPLQTYTVRSWNENKIELKMEVGSSVCYFKFKLD